MSVDRTPSNVINIIFLILALLCVAYYISLGVSVRFGQSLDFMWLIFAGFFLARFLLVGHMIRTGEPSIIPGIIVKLIHIGFAVFLVSFIVIEAMIVSAFSAAPPQNLDYIIVLGAKVNGTQPGGALRNRIDSAYGYWKSNPDTLIVASGGQGSDEGISEAQCMYNELTAKGVPSEAILLEQKSTSTYENIQYSLEFIENESATIGLVTNNFHLYRALKTARMQSENPYYGINVPTSIISFPHYMLREYFAVLHGYVLGSW